MKATELVAESLAIYEAALDIANRKLGIKSAKIAPLDLNRKVELNYLHIIKFTAEGKVEAATEILAALKEIEQ